MSKKNKRFKENLLEMIKQIARVKSIGVDCSTDSSTVIAHTIQPFYHLFINTPEWEVYLETLLRGAWNTTYDDRDFDPKDPDSITIKQFLEEEEDSILDSYPIPIKFHFINKSTNEEQYYEVLEINRPICLKDPDNITFDDFWYNDQKLYGLRVFMENRGLLKDFSYYIEKFAIDSI